MRVKIQLHFSDLTRIKSGRTKLEAIDPLLINALILMRVKFSSQSSILTRIKIGLLRFDCENVRGDRKHHSALHHLHTQRLSRTVGG